MIQTDNKSSANKSPGPGRELSLKPSLYDNLSGRSSTDSQLPSSIGSFLFHDDKEDLSVVSLERVVEIYKTSEQNRSRRTEPDNEAEISRRVRMAPIELMSSLTVVATRLGISRSLLTKCLSHHVIDWYAYGLDIATLASEYAAIYSDIKLASYTTLRIQAENPARFSFAHQPEETTTSVATIAWVFAKMSEISELLGVDATNLLLIGFCWSLTTLENTDWDANNIRRHFRPEVRNMEVLIQDRRIDVRSLRDKYNVRHKLGVVSG